MACAMGRHHTDIAIALYYVFHPTVPVDAVPEMKGHRNVEKKEFRYDDIAARLNAVMKSMTIEERNMLGLDAGYETEFKCRKKNLFEVNSMFR